jgi:hypothetical protein
MFNRVCLSVVLLVVMPASCQMISAGGATPGDQMLTPPPVNGEAYPNEVRSDARSNYLRAGVIFTPSYSNDVVGAVDAKPVSDVGYSIFSTISVDKQTPRMHWSATYNPGFTLYQRTSAENQLSQIGTLHFQYRVSPHITFSLRDSVQKISNVLNQPDALSGGEVSGSPQVPLNALIELVGDQLANFANSELTYQVSRNAMIGAQGTFTNLDFLKPTEVSGLYDSSSVGGSTFYSRRFSRRHYVGTTYQYSKILAYPPHAQSEIQTHTISLFYTLYLNRTFSLSISGGPQHYDISQSPMTGYGQWSPALTASMGWQTLHSNFAASYSRSITAGGGLLGVFQSNKANVSARWQLARTWNVGSAANYAINKNDTPATYLTTGGGHSISGAVSIQHPLSEKWRVEFGYTGVHQSYGGIPSVVNNPFISRVLVAFSYNFSKPLGR